MGSIWHIGIAVPDLEEGKAELGEVFGLQWRPARVRKLTLADAAGRPCEVECHVVFSLGGPFAVEVWQAIPGTPLATPESGWLHHLGYWVDDYPVEKRRLDSLGLVPFLIYEPTLLLSRDPGNICVEPCDLQRDQPYLRDLYPADSEFFGEPLLPAQA